ncbi:uncharacterized protein LOC110038077 [Phalaenopsis equestris]|uniref:uncharacterized protein LOC110038077 n=1 Tax=Phalaenopsis equestris TaxID=78828 RepID=UPI0009E3D9CF|nr:uncharacterized protein LOC110038077 [Phalaenopsis equestris]
MAKAGGLSLHPEMTNIKKSTQIQLERAFNGFLCSGQRQQVHWASWQKVAKLQLAGVIGFKEGLELLTEVFFECDERTILDCVFDLKDIGHAGLLLKKTYSEPQKWMRGKERITIQFGCCYNVVKDKLGKPPCILKYEEKDPLPSVIRRMIKRMLRWSVLLADCIPSSCIINIYEEGDCFPPHIDNHDFIRPFCTVSFMSKSSIMFGKEIDIVGP